MWLNELDAFEATNEPQSPSLSRHGQRPETQETGKNDLQHFGQQLEPFARDNRAFGFIPPNLSMSKCSHSRVRRSTQIEAAINTFQYFPFQTQARARQGIYYGMYTRCTDCISASMYPAIAAYMHQTFKKGRKHRQNEALTICHLTSHQKHAVKFYRLKEVGTNKASLQCADNAPYEIST